MRETEALSWRYGLLKQQQIELEQDVWDYEAEADKDFFGPGGILLLKESVGKQIIRSNLKSLKIDTRGNREKARDDNDEVVEDESERKKEKVTTDGLSYKEALLKGVGRRKEMSSSTAH